MANLLTVLESAMLKHMQIIIDTGLRYFSFLDFLNFEVDGKEYLMTHGTFRNKISKLIEKGIVELAYNSGIAFYTLKGVRLGKAAANLMTPNRIRVLLQHIHRIPNIKKHLLYKIIKNHPFDKAAVHDVQLKFAAAGLWSTTSSINDSIPNATLDPISKDLRLEKRVINELEIQVTIHRTDTVTIAIGCSDDPIAVDVHGIIRLSETLAAIEAELGRLIEQHSASGNNSNTQIPNHMSWVVTRWDFGIDALVTYTGEKFFFSWQTSYNVLIVFYTKNWGENDYRIRVELRESPNKPLGKALREQLSSKKGS